MSGFDNIWEKFFWINFLDNVFYHGRILRNRNNFFRIKKNVFYLLRLFILLHKFSILAKLSSILLLHKKRLITSKNIWAINKKIWFVINAFYDSYFQTFILFKKWSSFFYPMKLCFFTTKLIDLYHYHYSKWFWVFFSSFFFSKTMNSWQKAESDTTYIHRNKSLKKRLWKLQKKIILKN